MVVHTIAIWFIAVATIACSCLPHHALACQVCYAAGPASLATSALVRRPLGNSPTGLTFAALHRSLQRQPVATAATIIVLRRVAVLVHQKRLRTFVLTEQKEIASDGSDPDDPSNVGEDAAQTIPDPTSALMIGTIGFYKRIISPLLPPACRFVPTCSQYGVQAIEKYGPPKGCILIAWRLLRCSPIGGKGYDPPKWPPVPFQYSSY